MAIQKIDYEDKIGLQNDENIPNKNKVTDEDMNEIKSVVNNNADELTTAQQNIENLQTGQGTASTDITSLKNRVTTLETDNTTNKQDISSLKSRTTTLETDNETNKTNISTLQEDVEGIESNITELQTEQTAQNKKIEQLDDNQIHVTTEKAENINVQDSSGQNGKIKLFGVSKQEGTPSPGSPIEIENTTGNVEITDCNKNIANAEEIWENMHNYASSLCSEVIEDNKECIQFSNHAFRADLSTNPFNLINYKYKENVAYTIRMLVKRVSGSGSLYVEAVYSDGTKSNISVDTNEWAELRLVTNSSKTVARIGFSYSGITQYYLDKSSIFIAEVDTTDYIENEQQTITFPLQNQKMMEGSRTEDDGIHHKRKQITLTGNEQIVKYTKTFPNGYGYRVILNDVKANTEVLSSIYNYEKFSNFYWSSDITNKITTHDTTGGYVLVGSSKATIEEFRQEIANSVLEYETEEETIEAYTEAQQTAYNQLQNAKTYKKVTNVFTENAEVEMEYIADTKTYIDNKVNNMQNQLNTINELLSTTNTSALLLNNLQTDLESEVL